MTRLDCLFHFTCGNPAGSNEHVFPAGLGGRRTDRRLICDACQGWTAELDNVLPTALRLLNQNLGVVGDHSNRPARVPVNDPVTGRTFLMDEHLNLHGVGDGLVSEKLENGMVVQNYLFTGKAQQAATLKKLRSQGKKLEVFNETSAPIVLPRALNANSDFGGDDTFRAVARIALNFLGTHDPQHVRGLAFEPLKRWITGQPTKSEFAHFGMDLPAELEQPNRFEFGHRVLIGLEPGVGVLARVSFFETYQVAVRMSGVFAGEPQLLCWDIDPLALHQKPGVDVFFTSLEGRSHLRPSMLGDFITDGQMVVDRFTRGYARIHAVGLARATSQHIGALLQRLKPAVGLATPVQRERVSRAMAGEMQYAINLVSFAARILSRQVEPMGHGQVVAFLRHMVEEPEAETVVVALGEMLLLHLTERVAALVACDSISEDNLFELLEGLEGRTLAFKTLFGVLKQMPLWSPRPVADSPSRSDLGMADDIDA